MKRITLFVSLFMISWMLMVHPAKADAAVITTTGTAAWQQTAYLYPDSSAGTIYYTYKNDQLLILCSSGGYTLIAYPWLSSTITANKVVYGWVPNASVKANAAIPNSSSYFNINQNGTVNTPNAVLNVRVQPSTNALLTKGKDVSIIGTLPHNTTVRVLFELNGWYYIDTVINGRRTMGFVRKDYIVLNQSNVSLDPEQQKRADVIALAKNLKQALDAKGGAQKFTESQITSSLACYKAMVDCKQQAVYNTLILDITSAGVKATLESAKIVATGGVTLLPSITNTVKGVAKDALKSTLLDQIDRLSPDDYIYSLASNAYEDLKSQTLTFVMLHYKSSLDSYSDAVNYITLYQLIRMDSRTVLFGLDYFLAKLPSDFKSSLITVIRNSFSNFLPDSLSMKYDMANKVYELFSGSNIPLLKAYGQDMKALWNETMQLTGM